MRGTRSRCALIIGAFGQDGHYLSLHLAELGYQLVLVGRDRLEGGTRSGTIDVRSRAQVAELIAEMTPAEIYYLAAFHHSSEDVAPPLGTLLDESMAIHFDGLVNVLEGVVTRSPRSRVFMASSSLVFGNAASAPQNEDTALRPTTAYGVSKAAAMGACDLYRRTHGTFAVSGILFNHESPRRGSHFVSKKIVTSAANAAKGMPAALQLGALDAQVDWSAAEDVVRAAHAMLQVDTPVDCVIASGKLHTVRDFAQVAFDCVGLNYADYVTEDQAILRRPAPGVPRLGDASRLRKTTGFAPRVSFEDMVRSMVHAEMERAQ